VYYIITVYLLNKILKTTQWLHNVINEWQLIIWISSYLESPPTVFVILHIPYADTWSKSFVSTLSTANTIHQNCWNVVQKMYRNTIYYERTKLEHRCDGNRKVKIISLAAVFLTNKLVPVCSQLCWNPNSTCINLLSICYRTKRTTNL